MIHPILVSVALGLVVPGLWAFTFFLMFSASSSILTDALGYGVVVTCPPCALLGGVDSLEPYVLNAALYGGVCALARRARGLSLDVRRLVVVESGAEAVTARGEVLLLGACAAALGLLLSAEALAFGPPPSVETLVTLVLVGAALSPLVYTFVACGRLLVWALTASAPPRSRARLDPSDDV